jgi:transposase
MCRYDSDRFRWVIAPLLPNKTRGVPRVDDRRVLKGILSVLRSGAPWRDMPTVWPTHHLLQSLRALTKGRGVGPADGCNYSGLRW